MKGIPLTLSFVALAIAACFGESVENPAPLAVATRLAEHIEGDTDIKADTKLRVVDHLLTKRQFKEAKRLIDSLTDYRRAIGHSRLATAEWRINADADQLKAAITSAKPFSVRGENIAKDLAKMEMATAVAHVDSTAAQSLCKDIVDQEIKSQAELQLAVVNASLGSHFDLEKHRASIKAATDKGPFPAGLMAASSLLNLAVKLAEQDKAKALTLAANAGELAGLCGVEHCEFNFNLSHFYFSLEQEEEAKKAFAKAIKDMEVLPDGYELKATLYTSWAKLWKARGKQEDAINLLKRGAKLAEKLEPMQQPIVYAKLAGGLAQCDEGQLATEYFKKAVDISASNPNPRVGLLGGIEVCLVHSELGQQLNPTLLDSLLKLTASPALRSEP